MDMTTLRQTYAAEVTRLAVSDWPPLQAAYAAVPRERFLGPGPWLLATMSGYAATADDDPAHIYRNVVVALDRGKNLNNGEPAFWATLFDRLRPTAGERAIHVGAGSGYYSAILAELVGPSGRVTAIDYEPALAARAGANLADRPNVEVLAGDAMALARGETDVLVASCGFDAVPLPLVRLLRDGGRMLAPLTAPWPGLPGIGGGAMLLVTRRGRAFEAGFVSRVFIYDSMSGRTEAAGRRLAEAYGLVGAQPTTWAPPAIASLKLADAPDETCWLAGDGWWLSTAPA